MSIEWNTFLKKRRKEKRGFPTGTIFFTGSQGAGKSLSATHYIKKLKDRYPNLYIYSNIKLKIADKLLTSDQIADHILDVKDDRPIAFFIDEIQTVLFSGKKAVSMETFKAICQQRKAVQCRSFWTWTLNTVVNCVHRWSVSDFGQFSLNYGKIQSLYGSIHGRMTISERRDILTYGSDTMKRMTFMTLTRLLVRQWILIRTNANNIQNKNLNMS